MIIYFLGKILQSGVTEIMEHDILIVLMERRGGHIRVSVLVRKMIYMLLYLLAEITIVTISLNE